MIGRINTESLITLMNKFFEVESTSDMGYLVPRIFQNSGGKSYVPAEVRDQSATDAAELNSEIRLLPGLHLPLNETIVSKNLALIIPHISDLSDQIASMLPNEELRKVGVFANKSDDELLKIRNDIAGGYVYNVALKAAAELRQVIGLDATNISDLNTMNMCKLVGAVLLTFPDRMHEGAENYQQMALEMLEDLPIESPGKYDQTLHDCNVWTRKEKETIKSYSEMKPRDRVKAITDKSIQELGIKLILASANDVKEIDNLHSKFKKAKGELYVERLHAPLFEQAKLAISPKFGQAKSDPTPAGSKKLFSVKRKPSVDSSAARTNNMAAPPPADSNPFGLKKKIGRKLNQGDKIVAQSPTQSTSAVVAKSLNPDSPKDDLVTPTPSPPDSPRNNASEEQKPKGMDIISQGFNATVLNSSDDSKEAPSAPGSDGGVEKEESRSPSPGMRNSGSGENK